MATAIKTYSLRLPEDAIEALQNLALVQGVSASDLGRQAIDEFIARTAADAEKNFAAENERRRRALAQIQAYAGGRSD
jgi:predicted transcriptional regulator